MTALDQPNLRTNELKENILIRLGRVNPLDMISRGDTIYWRGQGHHGPVFRAIVREVVADGVEIDLKEFGTQNGGRWSACQMQTGHVSRADIALTFEDALAGRTIFCAAGVPTPRPNLP
jgi:hypothetical protein